MKPQLAIANISRMFARAISALDLFLGIPFLLFAGLQLLSGEAGSLNIYLYLLLLLGVLLGLVFAWWKEGLGVAIIFVSLLGSFVLSGGMLPGVGAKQGFALFVGPLNLIIALTTSGYHPDNSPIAKTISVVSWVMAIAPAMLFFTSWLLRRKPHSNDDEIPMETNKK